VPLEERHHLRGKCHLESGAALAGWQRGDAGEKLSQAHRAEVQRRQHLRVEPIDRPRRRRSQRLGHDVRVENDHRNAAMATGARSRAISSWPYRLLEDRTNLGFGALPVLRGTLLERAMGRLGQVSYGHSGHGRCDAS
jgi:hypothetical protein